jgi:RHS repeat-associated protein
VFDFLGAYRCECGEECYGGATATEPLELPSGGTQGGFDPSLGLPLVSGIGLPPEAGARLPLDTGLVYDPTGGAAGAGFGGSWLCGGLAGLKGTGGSAPVYYRGPNRAVAFDFNAASGTYTTRYFSLQTLACSGGGSSSSSSDSPSSSCGAAGYSLLEPCGRVVSFSPAGVVRSVAGSCSNVMNFSYGGDGRLQRIDVDLSSGSNSYVYTWSDLGGGRITEVVYSVGTRPVRRLVYGYAVSGNDLLTIMEFENTAATGAPVWSSQPVSAMRFTYHSDGLLRHVVGPEQWRRMKANNPATTPDPATAPADDLNEYASAEYEYASGRVSRMFKNGRAFAYEMSYQDNSPGTTLLNAWTRRTRVSVPGGAVRDYYYNRIGQLMLGRVAESAATTAKVWNRLCQKFEEGSGRLSRAAGADAIGTVNESSPELVGLKPTAGVITDYGYDGTGRRISVVLRKGTAGADVPQSATTYEARVTSLGTIYLPAGGTVYRNTDGTGAITTSFVYSDWFTDSFQYRFRTTVLPAVPVAEHGSGVSTTTVDEFNSRGFHVASTDEDGTVTDYTYDEAKGGMISMTRDAGAGRLNLRTDYTLDDLGREVLTLNPTHEGDIGGTPTDIRTAVWTYYKDAQAERWTFSGYRSAAGDRIVGPVTITRDCVAPPSGYSGWGQSETIDAVYVPGPTEPSIPAPDRTFGQSSWLRWQFALTDKFSLVRERRTYFHIPATGDGTRNVDYARTLLGYDDAGRQNQTTDPDDTIDKTTFNAVGWPVAQAVATLTTTGQSTLTTVRSDEFDDSGNLIRTTLPVDASTGHDRVTDFGYDWRNRPERQTTTVEKDGTGTWTLISVSTYDNLSQVVAVADYHTSYNSASPQTNRTGYRTSDHDPLGRTWQTADYAVNSAGVASNPQISGTWYTPTGRVARSATSGSKLFTATLFDAVGQSVKSYAAYSSAPVPSDPADVSNAVVMEQQELAWDQAGNLTATTTRQRLDTVPDTTLGKLTASISRTTYAAIYPDAVGRIFATADYGTNGSLNGSDGWTRLHTVPARSDDVLVSSTVFDTAGNPVTQTAPDSITTASTFDAADRRTVLVENSTGGSGTTRTTRYQYTAAGLMAKLLNDNPDTGTQTTEWVYGATTGQGSALNSNRLLREKIYPGGGADRETYTYNRQGQEITKSDPNGTVHAYTYDKLGVRIADVISTFGSGVDATVGKLEAGYNERRLQVRATSANASGSGVLNEVAWGYNDFNQPITEWQEHGGHVYAGSPKVQYTYADGSANTIRPTGITYPDGTTIATDYSSTQASALSRPDRISGSGGVIASWQYLGLGAVVSRKFDAASGVESTLGTAAAGYPRIDRFGRLVETLWHNGTTDLVHTQYGRNRAGGVVWQRNLLAHGLTPAVATEDSYYWYDGLRQVTRHDRGDLSGSPYSGVVAATRQQKETFTFDQTGNWNNTTSESPWLNQGRTHNPANEITAIGSPYGVAQPVFDAAGNMTTMPKPGAWDASLTCIWDAWNRLVRVRTCSASSSSSESGSSDSSWSSSESSASESSSSDPSASSSGYSSSESSSSDSSSSTSESSSSESSSSESSSSSGSSCVDATYQYDALTRRVITADAAETRHFYFNNQWRAVEERVSGAVKAQYVWNPADRWDLIRRRRSVAGTLDETRFVLRDYLDPAAIINPGGVVTERYRYDAFGPVAVLAPDFGVRAASECVWNFLYHAEFIDALTGLYNYGYRFYHPNLGRWISRDPIGETGGLNLFEFVGNDGFNGQDLLGMWITQVHHEISGELGNDINITCKCCSIAVRRWLQWGSDYADGAGIFFWRIFQAQSGKNAHEHGMTGPRLTPSEARRAFDQFVQQQISEAENLAIEAQKLGPSSRLKCDKLKKALFALGRAIHADADSMSPMHNFKRWDGLVKELTKEGLIKFFREMEKHQTGENMEVFQKHPEVIRKLKKKYDPIIKRIAKCA